MFLFGFFFLLPICHLLNYLLRLVNVNIVETEKKWRSTKCYCKFTITYKISYKYTIFNHSHWFSYIGL